MLLSEGWQIDPSYIEEHVFTSHLSQEVLPPKAVVVVLKVCPHILNAALLPWRVGWPRDEHPASSTQQKWWDVPTTLGRKRIVAAILSKCSLPLSLSDLLFWEKPAAMLTPTERPMWGRTQGSLWPTT